MLRVLGQIAVYGNKEALDRIASIAQVRGATLAAVGQKRRVPDTDFFCYASPWFRFRLEALDSELGEFLAAHQPLAKALAVRDEGVRHAMLTMCPVEQSSEEMFAFLLSHRTLAKICASNLELEVSPAEVMPEAPYWKNC